MEYMGKKMNCFKMMQGEQKKNTSFVEVFVFGFNVMPSFSTGFLYEEILKSEDTLFTSKCGERRFPFPHS